MKPLQKLSGFSIFLTFCLLLGSSCKSYGQLCTGTLGDPVVKITFGAGEGLGPALDPGITDYQYDFGACPNDGLYSIINKMSPSCHFDAWHRVEQDHTGDPNGYMMLVNAQDQTQLPNPTPGDFYVKKIIGLCPGTKYEFGAYVMNILKVPGFDPKLVFRIETTTGDTLKTKGTGDIPKTNSPTWVQYATQFTLPPGVSDVVLRIRNLAQGGNGNDLILDDITFRPCGPIITSGINGTTNKELTICEGTSGLFPLKAQVAGGGNQEYQWQTSLDGIVWSDIVGATNTETQATFTNAVPGTYQYRMLTAIIGNINSPNCRTASEPLKIKVNAAPIASASSNSPLCEGETLVLSASGGGTYSWTGPNGFSRTEQNPPLNNIGVNGSGQYQVIVKNAEGCETIKTVQVLVNSKPVSAFTSTSLLCETEVINFVNQSTISSGTITEWNWNFGDNTTSTLKNPSHTYLQAGPYSVSLTVKSNQGCVSVAKISDITVNPKAQVSFIDPGACVNDVSAQFMGVVNGAAPVQSWDWDFGDGSNDLTERFKQNPKHKYLSANNYLVVLKTKTASGCETIFSKSIKISGATPNAGFTVLNENTLCSNQPVTFQNTSAMLNGAFGQVTKIELNFNYTGASSDVTSTIDFPDNNAIFTHAYPLSSVDKTYQVQLKAYSGTVCYMLTQPKLITVKGSPTINFNAVPNICQDANPIDLKNFIAISNGYSPAGNWIFTGLGVSSSGMFNPSQAAVGSNVITALFNPNSNCASALKTQSITVMPSPSVDAGPDFTMLEGGEKEIQAVANANLTYKWTLANGSVATDLNRDDILRPIATPKDDVTYRLTITSTDGCTKADNVSIKVLKLPKVPNTFTPNGDNINDTWRILYLDSYPNATIEIYNRYGNRVFATSTYQEWDGRLNGSDLPVGTYYYIINPKNGRKTIKGYVTIVR